MVKGYSMNNINILANSLSECNIKYTSNAPMRDYTSFHIGGFADILIEPADESELIKVIGLCNEHGVSYTALGRGSNVLIKDDGIRGTVIRFGNACSKIELISDTTILCDAGVSLSQLCIFARDNNLSGLEFAYGIPGSVGGAVYMNAGAYGGEIKDVCNRAYYVDDKGKKGEYEADSLDFSYRHSVFDGKKLFITKASFNLQKGNRSEIKEKMDGLLAKRIDKQPIDMPSAGSTFKRPEGAFASALIDECGLKGFAIGGAQVSTKHAGFVINTGNATCADVMELIDYVTKTVFDKTGYKLEPEVKVL